MGGPMSAPTLSAHDVPDDFLLRRILLTLPEEPELLEVLRLARVYLRTRCKGIEASIVLRLIERTLQREERR